MLMNWSADLASKSFGKIGGQKQKEKFWWNFGKMVFESYHFAYFTCKDGDASIE